MFGVRSGQVPFYDLSVSQFALIYQYEISLRKLAHEIFFSAIKMKISAEIFDFCLNVAAQNMDCGYT